MYVLTTGLMLFDQLTKLLTEGLVVSFVATKYTLEDQLHRHEAVNYPKDNLQK